MNRLYLDIETIPSATKPTLDELKVPGNITKPESILKWKEENLESEYAKQALNSMQGQIVCICAALNDDSPMFIELDKLPDLIQFAEYPEIIGHNILGFDLPFEKITESPLPFMDKWINIDKMQTAAQETQLTNYKLNSWIDDISEDYKFNWEK